MNWVNCIVEFCEESFTFRIVVFAGVEFLFK